MSDHRSQDAASTAGAIFTIGHSTHSIKKFLSMLKAHGIETVVDIRSIPRSKRNPQFNSDALAEALKAAHIDYRHLKNLGGLRHARPDSANAGWHNASFRGYADYMQTDEFQHALGQLIALAKSQRVAVMCAESVPWRCHRSLVADVLYARRIPALHIMSETAATPHKLTAFAHIDGQNVSYPPPADLFSAAAS